ncbi:MAG: CHAP domain-containing protein [Ruminococcaceae bacterium]|nr:CHAP domain-containing protein [Oscillospiraceae bacterium]
MKKIVIAIALVCGIVLTLCTNVTISAKTATAKGIDVSEFQGDINWSDVKNEIDFAILRCGYGQNYTEQDDSKFVYNASECVRLGIPFGVYLYSYADTVEKAKSEAEHVLRLVKCYSLSLPVFLDMEDSTQLNISPSMRGQIATAFCDTISAAGYDVGIYANINWWTNYLTDSAFSNPGWTKWVAQYYSSCQYTGEYSCWQYTDSGSVSGIDGKVDMNYWYGNAGFSNKTTDSKSAESVLDRLKVKFPDGKYWNHVGMSGNNENGYTSTPCPSHSSISTCNAYTYNGVDIGWQCFGFACKLGYDAYGTNPKSWGRAYDLNNIKPGDIINYNGSNPGHTVFVTDVNGDIVTFAECNYGSRCIISWGRSLSKSQFSNLYNVYVAPYALDGGTTSTTPDEHSCSNCISVLKGGYVNVSSVLNVRYGPGTNYAKVFDWADETALRIKTECNGWYFAQDVDGNSGWVLGDYVEITYNSSEDINESYPTPFQCYTLKGTTYEVYSSIGGSKTGGYIASNDVCRVEEIYANGWLKVTYPISGGTRTAYSPSSEFFDASYGNVRTATISTDTTAYYRSDLADVRGTAEAGDVCTIIGESGDCYCVLCPWSTSSAGRFLVWIYKSAFAHTHSYSWRYEGDHPHREYMKCDCGDYYYTGENVYSSNYILEYEAAHPHRQYKLCGVCGHDYTEYTGLTREDDSCSTCTAPGKPEILNIKNTYTNEDEIVFTWGETTNTDYYNWYIDEYDPNEAGYEGNHYVRLGHEVMVSSVTRTLPIGKYRVSVVAYNTKHYTDSDWYYFEVVDAYPGKPEILNIKNTYTNEDEIVFTWGETTNTDYYNWYIDEYDPNEAGYEGNHYVRLGHEVMVSSVTRTLPIGKYRVSVVAYNTKHYTDSDWYYFEVVDAYYTISYNSNGGENTPETHRVLRNTVARISNIIPTREGYIFEGWAISEDGEVVYSVGAEYTANESVTLYAKWSKIDLAGDADGDNKITVVDGLLCLRYVLNGGETSILDMNGDGTTNLIDVLRIMKEAVK